MKKRSLLFFACSKCYQETPKNHDKNNRYGRILPCCLADADNYAERGLAYVWDGKAF